MFFFITDDSGIRSYVPTDSGNHIGLLRFPIDRKPRLKYLIFLDYFTCAFTILIAWDEVTPCKKDFRPNFPKCQNRLREFRANVIWWNQNDHKGRKLQIWSNKMFRSSNCWFSINHKMADHVFAIELPDIGWNEYGLVLRNDYEIIIFTRFLTGFVFERGWIL